MSDSARWLILTEDTSDYAQATVHTLARHLCACALDLRALPDIKPEAPGRDLSQAVGACLWEQRTHAITLARELVTRLKLGEFVVLHHDGDTRWSMRRRGGTLAARLEEKVLRKVKDALGEDWPVLRHNLLLLVPYYHIESWLYLNRREVQRLIDEGRVSRDAIAQIDVWLTKDSLDEVEQIGTKSPIGKNHNHRLAERQFPAQGAVEMSPSFAATVARWRESASLRRVLRP